MIYSITLKCGTTYDLIDLEDAGVSYVPSTQRDGKDEPLFTYGDLWGEKRQVTLSSFGKKAHARTMGRMTGLQIMTGYPTYRRVGTTGYIYLVDIDIEKRFIEQFPKHYQRVLEVYRNTVEGTPCEIITKSGGRRLSAYTEYAGVKVSFRDPNALKLEKGMLLEIFSLKGLSRIDNRYAQAAGSLLNIPTLPKPSLIQIHEIASEVGIEKTENKDRIIVDASQLGDLNITWDNRNRSQLFPTSHCQATTHQSNRDEVRFTRYADGSVDGKCFNCGELWWDIPPVPSQKRVPPVRLFVAEYNRETETLEKQRQKLLTDLLAWDAETRDAEGQHLLNVTMAAGVGKTTTTIKAFENIFYLSPTKELADQAFSIADALGRDAWRHRPRMHNRELETWDQLPLGLGVDERPCIYPEACNNLAMRGHDPVPIFCAERCPVYNECRKVSFLSQMEIERKKQSVFMAYDELIFSDERYKSQVEKILNNEKMLVIDEPTPAGLTQKREIVIDDLLSTLNVWKDPASEVHVFLKKLLEKLSTAQEPEQIRVAIAESVKVLNADDVRDLDDALSKIPVEINWERDLLSGLHAVVRFADEVREVFLSDDRKPPKGYHGTIPRAFVDEDKGVEINTSKVIKVSLDVFDRMGFVDITQDAMRVPRRYTNFVKYLKTFIESRSKACYRTQGTIVFALPPGLNAPRGITLTASDTDDLIGRVYSNTNISVKTLKSLPSEFRPGNKFFQISTGRYTPNTGLLRKNKGDATFSRISHVMRRMLTVILKVADTQKVLVVGPKAIENPNLDVMTTRLHFHPNIEVINHYHAEGGNNYEHFQVVFVFHFEPSVDEMKRIAPQVYINQKLSFERMETDIVVDGVTLKNVMRYKDKRVQSVFDRECERRIMQTLMRLRPMLYPNKILVSFSAEPVTRMPIPPVPFTLPLLERYTLKENGDLYNFDNFLEKHVSRSAKEIEKQDRISQRMAYYRSQENRSNKKEALMAEAHRLRTQENLSYRKIAQRLKDMRMTNKLKSHVTIAKWVHQYNTK